MCAFLLIIGLSGSAYSGEIKISCKLSEWTTLYFKYQDNFLMSDNAYARLEGKWVDICIGIETGVGMFTGGKIRTWSIVDDLSAACVYDFPSDSFGELKWIVDFETKTWSKYQNGKLREVLGMPSNGDCI